MSLTHLIKTSSLFRNKILELFPMPKITNDKLTIIYPPLINSYGIIGTAFDYLLRFYLQWKYNKILIIQTKEYLIADIGIVLLSNTINTSNKIKINSLIDLFEKYQYLINQILKQRTWELNDDFLIALIFYSNLDIVYRVGKTEHLINDRWKYNLNTLIKELRQLATLLTKLPINIKQTVNLNPTFKIIPSIINKADADLIVDNELLIDIKTTQKLTLTKQDWCQLIGYYALCYLNNIEIKTLAIYYARFNFLFQVNIEQYHLEQNLELFVQWIYGFK